MPKTGCGAEPPCLFGRKSVHKSGCFRVSSVKYDNRCEKDGELSVGEGKSWRNEKEREKEREGGRGGYDPWVNLGASTYLPPLLPIVRPPRLKVTGDVFFNPFHESISRRAPVGFSRARVSLRKFADYSCERATYQLVKWVNSLDKYVLCGFSPLSRSQECLAMPPFTFTLLFLRFYVSSVSLL